MLKTRRLLLKSIFHKDQVLILALQMRYQTIILIKTLRKKKILRIVVNNKIREKIQKDQNHKLFKRNQALDKIHSPNFEIIYDSQVFLS
jgi:hypothetical protein